MYRFFRWYNQNRKQILTVVIVVAAALIVIQILNSLIAIKNEKERNEMLNRNTYVDKTINPSPTNTSIITGEKVTEVRDNVNKNIIKQFVEYCNNDKVQEAYDMLSDECKELLYPTVDFFKQTYYQNIFYIDRIYSLQNWYIGDDKYTYYIKYTEDVLATGNLNSSENKGDYITILKKGEKYYLNISGFVERQEKNSTIMKNNVNINVNWIDMYINYTIFNITVENNTGKTICLDSKEDVSTTYIYDGNNVRYTSFLNENAMEQLVVKDQRKSTINIKFNKLYNKSRVLTGIAFQDIVLNYDDYISKKADKEKISIDMNI